MVGALWYSLLFFNTWVKIFLLDKNKIMQGGDMIRSFIIQFATGTLYGFVVFTMCGFAQWFGVAGVLAIAGWQMCALTFKYHGWKPFLTALMIESGYTVVGGAIYVVFAQF